MFETVSGKFIMEARRRSLLLEKILTPSLNITLYFILTTKSIAPGLLSFGGGNN
jgi:hypothetical protein